DRGARGPPRRGRPPHRHGAQGRGPHRPDPVAPGVLLLPVRRVRTPPAHPAGAAQADLAGGVDQQLLRPPGTRRGPGRRRAAPRPAGARGRRGAGPGPPGVPLPGGDAGRDAGERALPGVRRPHGRCRRAGPGRGGRDGVGRLADLQRRRARRRARGLAVVPHAGDRPRRGPGRRVAGLRPARRCRPLPVAAGRTASARAEAPERAFRPV
ncbi:MAG: Isopentenyl-diphosphate Delta-isomerase, partial [uncultured Nocardioidaceae bacterium]